MNNRNKILAIYFGVGIYNYTDSIYFRVKMNSFCKSGVCIIHVGIKLNVHCVYNNNNLRVLLGGLKYYTRVPCQVKKIMKGFENGVCNC